MGFIVAIANILVVSAQDVLIKKLRGESTFFLIWLRMAAALPVRGLLVAPFAPGEIPAPSSSAGGSAIRRSWARSACAHCP